jgi:hypothetical protein
MIDQYLIEIENKLREIADLILDYSLKVERPEFTGLVHIKGEITFFEGSSLTFSQLFSGKPISYRFHLMDAEKTLIRRWDSAPHHRELNTFPFHMHTPNGVHAAKAINLPEAIDGSIEILLQNI